MYIRTQKVDRHIECMTDHKYNDKENHSSDALSAHASHLVDYGSDNSGCKAKCQQTGVGKYITEPTCNVVQIISTQCNAKSRILAGTAGEQYDSNCTQDRAPFCCCIESCREYDLFSCNACKHAGRDQNTDQSKKQHVPEYNVTDKIHIFVISDTHISL